MSEIGKEISNPARRQIQPTRAGKFAQKPTGKAVGASTGADKTEPSFADDLKTFAKSVLLFGGLGCLIFYWKQAGLMAESIAVPSMCICTALFGWSIGKFATQRGNR